MEVHMAIHNAGIPQNKRRKTSIVSRYQYALCTFSPSASRSCDESVLTWGGEDFPRSTEKPRFPGTKLMAYGEGGRAG